MRTSNASYTIVLLLATGLVPALAAAQPGPRGPDISVTTDPLGGYLECPAVAMSARGHFEVVWNHSYSYSNHVFQGMFARHFDRWGRPTQPAAIRLDLEPYNLEVGHRSIVALPGTGYFVVWLEWDGGSRSDTVGRFLDSAGLPRGPVLLLKHNAIPIALALVNGKLLVAWQEGSAGSESDAGGPVWARRFDLAGHGLGRTMLLTNHQQLGGFELAPLADSFVAIWERWTGTSWTVETQRFSLAGKPLGAELRLNDNPSDYGVKVASNGNDRYAVAWTERTQTGPQEFDAEPRVQFFDLSGARGPATNPTEPSAGAQHAWGLAMDSRGSALVTWISRTTGSPDEVKGRFLDATGQPASEVFSLVQDLRGEAWCSNAAAGGGADAWVAVWLRYHDAIFARRLALAAE